jgi:membrane protease YdiL (CAAX protease family)
MPARFSAFGRVFAPSWAMTLVTLVLVVLFVRRVGGKLADVGMVTSPRRLAVMLVVLTMIGAGFVFLRAHDPRPAPTATVSTIMLPATTAQRAFWIAMCLTAALCEEFVYRGFGICALRARGMSAWLAVPMASTSFVFVHGLAGVFAFPIYFVIGLLFSALFVWRRTLAPGICIHGLFDLMAILA